jgi:hypothetical protein
LCVFVIFPGTAPLYREVSPKKKSFQTAAVQLKSQMENVDKLVSAMQKQGENVEKLMEAIARK